jgi:hypothetical protein
MDLKQKYIEDSLYEIDDWFFSQLQGYRLTIAADIIGQIIEILPELPKINGWSQKVAGVCEGNDPVFFAIEFLNQEQEVPILVDIETIDVDDYLDYIINNQHIKYYTNEQIQSNTKEGVSTSESLN